MYENELFKDHMTAGRTILTDKFFFQVVDSLRTLLKFDLASFEPSANEVIADYKLIPENVLLLIRYPR